MSLGQVNISPGIFSLKTIIIVAVTCEMTHFIFKDRKTTIYYPKVYFFHHNIIVMCQNNWNIIDS